MSRDLMYASEIEDMVYRAYAGIVSPHGSALWLYDQPQLAGLPAGAKTWALGVGNPVPHAGLRRGETVLDLGCGAGIDVLLAAREVGAEGRVIGLDGVESMLERASTFAAEAGADNVEFVLGAIDAIPLPDDSVDVIISNGAINLAARKSRVFAEAARVLKPRGRITVADLTIVEDDIPPEVLTHPSAWAG